MRGMVPPDPETSVSTVEYAVVYVPRRSRNRFPKNCVTICKDRDDALAQADAQAKLIPARVAGPSKSSEGQYIYYLVEWL